MIIKDIYSGLYNGTTELALRYWLSGIVIWANQANNYFIVLTRTTNPNTELPANTENMDYSTFFFLPSFSQLLPRKSVR